MTKKGEVMEVRTARDRIITFDKYHSGLFIIRFAKGIVLDKTNARKLARAILALTGDE